MVQIVLGTNGPIENALNYYNLNAQQLSSMHVIVFSTSTTIILQKMGPVHTIGLAKQSTHSRAPNKFSYSARVLEDDDDDTAFLQKLSSSSSRPFIDLPHVIVFSTSTTIILQKLGPVNTIGLAKQFPHFKLWSYKGLK